MKVFVVAALHGDEPFGIKIIERLQDVDNKHIVTKVGHPEALAKNKRYLDQDLNRSFNSEQQSTESAIARDIEREIRNSKADLIIDIHASISNVGQVAIVARRSPFIEHVASCLGMEAIVIMPQHVVEVSLVGCFPGKAISLEFGKTRQSDELAADISSKIEMLEFEPINSNNQLLIFKVYGQIEKKFKGLPDIKNLTFNNELQGYPFLAGVNTYETIGGFIAKKVNEDL